MSDDLYLPDADEFEVQPSWVWVPTAATFMDLTTGRYIAQETLLRWVGASIRASTNSIHQLARMLAGGQLDLGMWQQLMRQEIKGEYIRQYLLGRGGLAQMTQVDWGSIGGMLAEQYRYLDGFAADIAGGNLTEGGPGSGHWGHAGVPGQHGGSAPSVGGGVGAAMSIARGRTAAARQAAAAGREPPKPPEPATNAMGWKEGEALGFVSRQSEVKLHSGEYRRLTDAEATKVAEWVEEHPRELFGELHMSGGVRSIVMYDAKAWQRENIEVYGKANKAAAYYDTKYAQIHGPLSMSQGTFAHEVGHGIYRAGYGVAGKRTWIKSYNSDPKFDRHTAYAKTNVEEGFCESYEALVGLVRRRGADFKSPSPWYRRTFEVVQAARDGVVEKIVNR